MEFFFQFFTSYNKGIKAKKIVYVTQLYAAPSWPFVHGFDIKDGF